MNWDCPGEMGRIITLLGDGLQDPAIPSKSLGKTLVCVHSGFGINHTVIYFKFLKSCFTFIKLKRIID